MADSAAENRPWAQSHGIDDPDRSAPNGAVSAAIPPSANQGHVTEPRSFDGKPFDNPPPAGRPRDPQHASRDEAPRGNLVPIGQPQAPESPRMEGPAGGPGPESTVPGRIDIADEVIEKVTAAAAYEVEGVADLGRDPEGALENLRDRIGIGKRDDDDGVRADLAGGKAEIDVTLTVKYGHSIVEVARRVQANVVYQAKLMLGLTVTAVNVNVDDIEMPDDALSYKDGSQVGGFSLNT